LQTDNLFTLSLQEKFGLSSKARSARPVMSWSMKLPEVNLKLT